MLAVQIVSSGCRNIRTMMNYDSEHGMGTEKETIIVAYLQCIRSWIMQGKWVVRAQNLLVDLLEIVEIGLTGRCFFSAAWQIKTNARSPLATESTPSSSSSSAADFSKDPKVQHRIVQNTFGDPTEKIKTEAELLFLFLVNIHGSFPTPTGCTSISALPTEKDIHAKIETHKQASNFLFNQTVLTVIPEVRRKGLSFSSSLDS